MSNVTSKLEARQLTKAEKQFNVRMLTDKHGRPLAPTGVLYEQPNLIDASGTLFRVPAAYLPFWPRPEHVGKINVHGVKFGRGFGLSFIFWMWDKAPVEIKLDPPLPTLRHREPGRPQRQEPDFGVYVRLLEFLIDDGSIHLSPSDKFNNYARVNKGRNLFTAPKHGLQRHYFEGDPLNPGGTRYRHVPGKQPQVLLSCSPPASILPNPLCTGRIQFDDIALSFDVWFTRDALAHWRNVAMAIRELALKWRVSN